MPANGQTQTQHRRTPIHLVALARVEDGFRSPINSLAVSGRQDPDVIADLEAIEALYGKARG